MRYITSKPARRALLPCASRPAAASASRPTAASASRTAALRVAPCCSQRVTPYYIQRVAPCYPARRAMLQPARHALLQPARRALLPYTSRPAAASVSRPTAASALRFAAPCVAPCCSQHVAPYCSQRVVLCCPTHRALLPCTARALLPSPLSRPAATTSAAAARATAAAGGGAAGSAGSAAGAEGTGGATGSAVRAPGARGAGPTTDSHCLSWPLSRQLQRLGVDSGGHCHSRTTPPLSSFASGLFSEPVHVVEALVFYVLHRGGSRRPSPRRCLVRWLRRVRYLHLASLQRLARVGYSPTRLSSGTTASVTPPYRISAVCIPVSLSQAFPGPCPPSRAHLPRRTFPVLRGGRHSSEFPPTTTPLHTLQMDVWGQAPVGGTDQEHYFLLVVDDYTRYTTVFSLRCKADISGVLISWIRATRRQLCKRFSQDFPVLRLQSDRGVSSLLSSLESSLKTRASSNRSRFRPLLSKKKISERPIGLIMEVACTSMIHATAPHFLSPFSVQYAAHQLNLWPRVSAHTLVDREGWRCVGVSDPLSPHGPAPSGVSQVDPPPLVEPLEISSDSSGPAEGGDPAADDTAATRRSPRLETPLGFPPRPSSPPPQLAAVDSGAETAGAELGSAETEGEGSGGAATGGAATRGAGSEGASTRGAGYWGAATGSADSGGPASPSGSGAVGDPARGPGSGQAPQPDLLETLSPQAIHAWIVRGTAGGAVGAAGAGGAGATSLRGATGAGGAGPTSPGGTAGAGGAGGAASAGGAGAGGTGGTGAAGPGGARTRGARAVGGSGAVRAGGATRAAGCGGTKGNTGDGGSPQCVVPLTRCLAETVDWPAEAPLGARRKRPSEARWAA
ncbi:unnamed protein product [Closterium sp. NIES-53]